MKREKITINTCPHCNAPFFEWATAKQHLATVHMVLPQVIQQTYIYAQPDSEVSE